MIRWKLYAWRQGFGPRDAEYTCLFVVVQPLPLPMRQLSKGSSRAAHTHTGPVARVDIRSRTGIAATDHMGVGLECTPVVASSAKFIRRTAPPTRGARVRMLLRHPDAIG